MPIGVEISVAKPTIIRLPTIALAMPPPAVPGAGVFLKKKSGVKAASPFEASVQRIQIKPIRPITNEIELNARPRKLASLRRL